MYVYSWYEQLKVCMNKYLPTGMSYNSSTFWLLFSCGLWVPLPFTTGEAGAFSTVSSSTFFINSGEFGVTGVDGLSVTGDDFSGVDGEFSLHAAVGKGTIKPFHKQKKKNKRQHPNKHWIRIFFNISQIYKKKCDEFSIAAIKNIILPTTEKMSTFFWRIRIVW